jgi:hypothetical protein
MMQPMTRSGEQPAYDGRTVAFWLAMLVPLGVVAFVGAVAIALFWPLAEPLMTPTATLGGALGVVGASLFVVGMVGLRPHTLKPGGAGRVVCVTGLVLFAAGLITLACAAW